MATSSNAIERQEIQNKMNLAAARMQSSLASSSSASNLKNSDQKKLSDAARSLAKEGAKLPLSLLKQIDWLMDWMILIPLFFAVAKDLLNYVGFNLPGINEVFSFSIGCLLFLILMALGSNQNKSFRKYIANIVGMALEEIYGLNFLPIETITVIVCFTFVLVERMETAEARKENPEEEGEG